MTEGEYRENVFTTIFIFFCMQVVSSGFIGPLHFTVNTDVNTIETSETGSFASSSIFSSRVCQLCGAQFICIKVIWSTVCVVCSYCVQILVSCAVSSQLA